MTWHDHFVDSGGVRIATRDYGGDGPAMVLVHGFYGNLGDFDELAPILARDFHVVAYDQRGHGWSETGPVSIERYHADLAAVADAFALQRPWLYGGSFGTLVCLAYAQAGGEVAGFVSEDGRVADAPVDAARDDVDVDAEVHDQRRIVTPPVLAQVAEGFSAFGQAGAASFARSTVHLPNGTFELRPSQSDLNAKERAFRHMRIVDAYRGLGGRSLLLAARTEDTDEGRARAEAIQRLADDTGVVVQSFPTSHWISAADPSGVADAVVDFVRRGAHA